MPSLVEELQRDALNANAKVSDLLRKAKAIAVKLELPELEDHQSKVKIESGCVMRFATRWLSGRLDWRSPV